MAGVYWPVVGLAALTIDPARPITHRVTVQIIETALSDGTSPATVFGNSSQRSGIEAAIDSVWSSRHRYCLPADNYTLQRYACISRQWCVAAD